MVQNNKHEYISDGNTKSDENICVGFNLGRGKFEIYSYCISLHDMEFPCRCE
jgi:hypothetical protein